TVSPVDAIILATVVGSIVVFGGAAVLALGWAFRSGQFDNFQQGALSIFGPDEPVREPTDAFPGEPPRDAGERQERKRDGRACRDEPDGARAVRRRARRDPRLLPRAGAVLRDLRPVLAARRLALGAHCVDQATQSVLPDRQPGVDLRPRPDGP